MQCEAGLRGLKVNKDQNAPFNLPRPTSEIEANLTFEISKLIKEIKKRIIEITLKFKVDRNRKRSNFKADLISLINLLPFQSWIEVD